MECSCKRCNGESLEKMDRYSTYNDLEDTIEYHEALVCNSCGCAHWDGKWEYPIGQEVKINQVAGWATNKS